MDQFKKLVRRRKVCLYALLALASVAMLFFSVGIFRRSLEGRLNPQIQWAAVQVAQSVPQLEQNEQMLNAAYDQMAESWQKMASSGLVDYEFNAEEDRAEFDELVSGTLSWMNQVTNLTVGSDGYVMVLSKETGEVLAHPNEQRVGMQYALGDGFSYESAISVDDVTYETQVGDLNPAFVVMTPVELKDWNITQLQKAGELLELGVFGSVIDYKDTYIVCGVPLGEMASYIALNAGMFLVFFVVLMWLLTKWICLVLAAHQETPASLRAKLFSYGAIACLLLFGISWYSQALSDVTDTLMTLSKDADAAAATLSDFEDERTEINHWLDNFYLNQCWIASKIVTKAGRENLTREDLQRYADDLHVSAIYVFDKDGNVVVTNSNYDSFALSDDPSSLTYGLRPLLDGRQNVVLDPVLDEWYNEPVQYVGVSTRDEQDLCNGFVMIATSPMLREALLAPLSADYVLGGMSIGLPDYVLAISKKKLEVVSSTGVGSSGQSIESLGLKEEDLTEDFGGFLKINGVRYYAGISESSDLYLVALVKNTNGLDSFMNALRLLAFSAGYALVVAAVTLLGYGKILDAVPEDGPEVGEHAEPETANAVATAVAASDANAAAGTGSQTTQEPEGDSWELFSGISNFIKTQKKYGFEDRWDVNEIPKEQMTPEQRILKIIYRLLLLFCVFVLLPTLYLGISGGAQGTVLNNLAYVVSGNWQKGLNIFAVTSCIFLLCAMYVGVALLNRILFGIAKVSDTRVETVCLLIKNSARYVCAIVFVYYGLSRFGVDTQTLLASAGILTMMISFGAQDLVKDILAGFFTIFEGTYKVGDYINVGGWFGAVTEIGLRTTKVTRYADTKIFNNSSVRDIVNSDGDVARVKLEMPVSYDTDLTALRELLNEELPLMAEKIPGLRRGPRYDGVERLDGSAVILRITVYVTGYLRGRAERALTEEVKLLFDREGIEIPFEQVVVHEAE